MVTAVAELCYRCRAPARRAGPTGRDAQGRPGALGSDRQGFRRAGRLREFSAECVSVFQVSMGQREPLTNSSTTRYEAPMNSYDISVLPGDGIGVEVTHAALEVLHALEPKLGRRFATTIHPA